MLTKFEEGVFFLRSHKNDIVEKVTTCLKQRVKVQHSALLSHSLALLATQGWNKPENAELADVALDSLISHFKTPLERAGVDTSVIKEEWEDMIDYARRYLDLVQQDYRAIWWKLFNAANANRWANVLSLIELLFCIPMSNGRVERVFSALKFIKSDRRSSLSEDTLDHLVRITVDGPPLAQLDASPAVHLWWRKKQRRQVQNTRAAPRPSTSHGETESTETYTLNLEDWDTFVA